MRNTIARVSNKSGHDRYHNIETDLLEMTHGRENRITLERRATAKGAHHFFFCARCGEKLTPSNCPRCRIVFQALPSARLVARMAPPVIPAMIANYAEEQGSKGSKFKQFVLRPRQL